MVGIKVVVVDYRVKKYRTLARKKLSGTCVCIYVIHFSVMDSTTLSVTQTNTPSSGRKTVSNNF
jgi:hypothetical protein